jgi:hypothetical protein
MTTKKQYLKNKVKLNKQRVINSICSRYNVDIVTAGEIYDINKQIKREIKENSTFRKTKEFRILNDKRMVLKGIDPQEFKAKSKVKIYLNKGYTLLNAKKYISYTDQLKHYKKGSEMHIKLWMLRKEVIKKRDVDDIPQVETPSTPIQEN